ncbi:MAG: hypothetical protein DMG53_16645 [Acidobacteria bacterium]|nr:MAG: hypothetical protein DMG53_16645 [Acidobacteriota bacterium]
MKNLCHLPRSSAGFLWFGVFTILALAGCKQNGHTSDPRLRQIDEMLDSQLPSGAARSRVTFYLSSQNFPVEDTRDHHEIVAIVHHVDTDTLQPATARVTFHFDTRNNLKSYELVTAAGTVSQP